MALYDKFTSLVAKHPGKRLKYARLQTRSHYLFALSYTASRSVSSSTALWYLRPTIRPWSFRSSKDLNAYLLFFAPERSPYCRTSRTWCACIVDFTARGSIPPPQSIIARLEPLIMPRSAISRGHNLPSLGVIEIIGTQWAGERNWLHTIKI